MNPFLIKGGVSVDDRGALQFANDFDVGLYRRFYIIRNHRSGFVRAWHGHRVEGKAFTVVSGSAVIGAVSIDNWTNPNTLQPVERVVLSATSPSVFVVPPGFANGLMTLQDDTEILVFSTLPFDAASHDDFRFDARLWNIWDVKER